jgi:hypothetical protein
MRLGLAIERSAYTRTPKAPNTGSGRSRAWPSSPTLSSSAVDSRSGHALELAQLGQITPALELLEDYWQRAHRLDDLPAAHQTM